MSKFVTVDFIRQFVLGRIGDVSKDIAICMEPIRDDVADAIGAKRGERAYVPAIMACCGLLELLSALYLGPPPKEKGKGKGASGPDPIKRFAAAGFLSAEEYNDEAIDVLWETFRHKFPQPIHPCLVPVVHSNRYVWTVTADSRSPAIRVEALPEKLDVASHLTPWRVSYSHRITVSISKLHFDAVAAAHCYMMHVADTSKIDHYARLRIATKWFKRFMPPASP